MGKNIRLEDIEKKNIFSVTPDYFEHLPTLIQKRVSSKESLTTNHTWKWRFALPAMALVLLLLGGIFFKYNNLFFAGSTAKAEAQLKNIPEEVLFNYVQNSNLDLPDMIELAVQSNKPIKLDEIVNDLEVPNEVVQEEIEQNAVEYLEL